MLRPMPAAGLVAELGRIDFVLRTVTSGPAVDSVRPTDHWFTCAPARRATSDAARCLPRRTRNSAGAICKQRDAVAQQYDRRLGRRASIRRRVRCNQKLGRGQRLLGTVSICGPRRGLPNAACIESRTVSNCGMLTHAFSRSSSCAAVNQCVMSASSLAR